MPTTAANAAALPLLPRRRLLAVLLLPALLAACVESAPPPTDFQPLDFGYLTKLRLKVASVDIDDEFAKREAAGTDHVEALAPVQPADALERMARERLIPVGTSGHAVFVIEDASLFRVPGGFQGNMHVRLDVTTSDGAKSGFAEARASRTYTTDDTSDAGTRAALYGLVKLMMADMNVEFEYQLKRTLRDYLQTGAETAPPPAPVEQQDLNGAPPMPGPGATMPPAAAPTLPPAATPTLPPAAPPMPSVPPAAVPMPSVPPATAPTPLTPPPQ